MVLYHCEIRDDKRLGLFCNMERNPDFSRDDRVFDGRFGGKI